MRSMWVGRHQGGREGGVRVRACVFVEGGGACSVCEGALTYMRHLLQPAGLRTTQFPTDSSSTVALALVVGA